MLMRSQLFITLFKLKIKLRSINIQIRQKNKGHFFTFKIWKNSISVRYLIDGIAIIAVGIFLQKNFNNVQDLGVKWYSIYPTYLSQISKLNDLSLTVSQKAVAQTEFNKTEELFLEYGNLAYEYLINNYIIFSIMTAYCF